MKLGTLLLRNAAIGLSQLESALRNQVLYGGRLGTNLVELGYIDLELLSAYLAELSGFPIATPTLLDDVDPRLLERLGSDDAHRMRAIPLGYLSSSQIGGEGTEVVAVAIVEPTNADLLAELTHKLGARVTPYVVPELRALYYLEKHFGLPRRARFVRSGTDHPDTSHEGNAERRRQQPAHGMVMPPAFTLEPRKRRASSQLPITGGVPLTLSYGAACERIDTAPNRDQIADTFVEYAKGRCDALVVFLIRDGNALGWHGYLSLPTQTVGFDELSLPLGGASSLQAAHDGGVPYVGPPPSTARPVESQLWSALGTSPDPTTVIVVPILVKQRAVNLVYAHLAMTPPSPQLVTELTDLAHRAQDSYARLIRQARGS